MHFLISCFLHAPKIFCWKTWDKHEFRRRTDSEQTVFHSVSKITWRVIGIKITKKTKRRGNELRIVGFKADSGSSLVRPPVCALVFNHYDIVFVVKKQNFKIKLLRFQLRITHAALLLLIQVFILFIPLNIYLFMFYSLRGDGKSYF